ncbi:MAG: nicotinate-nucleotide adenylyltransferase [Phycisphaerae bacterium]
MTARIGLYGGSFDPIHFGHLISARAVADALNLTKIVLIPAASPPHKLADTLAPAADRLAMAQLAVRNDPLFEVDDLELHRPGPSFTFDTVTEFRRRLGSQAELFWIIGGDTLPELATWHRIPELVGIVAIVTTVRHAAGKPDLSSLASLIPASDLESLRANCLETPAIQISSTDIRNRTGRGRSIRYLTPDPVVVFIDEHGLYRTLDKPAEQ